MNIHKSLENAIDGEFGAKALLLKKGVLATKWKEYGRPFFVFVWKDGDLSGCVIRLNPKNVQEPQAIRIPADVIDIHETKSSGSEAELNALFAEYEEPW